jgi:putative FmdB family regulatory protein
MPIYAYRCTSCGFENDHLQKLSDPVLEICPQCAQATYRKQLTAAGFQLKGSGWYATDFKGDKSKESREPKEPKEPKAAAKPESSESAPSAAGTDGATACAGN